MSPKSLFARLSALESLNFLVTNRIPRLALTRFMGRFCKIEQPLVRDASIALWRWFCDVDLTDATETRFASLHAAFIRALRPGARVVDGDPAVVCSPCDAILGAHGPIAGGEVLQIKGAPYPLAELLGCKADAAAFEGGSYFTLRLTAGMYHRFHAPHDLVVERLRYISGDTWNVNAPALRRIDKLFCKNERAPMLVRLEAGGQPLMLVPVAAVLVASIRLPWFDAQRSVREGGERVAPCAARFAKGAEMGWFEHGSTIVVLAPPGLEPVTGLVEGARLAMGQPLLRLDSTGA
jgi:phosphatidylserine decarboxylase